MLESLLTQTAHYATPSGRANGVEVFGAPVPIAVRHERVDVLVTGADGTIRRASHKVASAVAIPRDALYWPPGVSTSDENDANRPLTYNEASTPEFDITLFETFF